MKVIMFLFGVWLGLSGAQAKLAVKAEDPKSVGEKSVIKLTLKNTFAEKVEPARATLFLLDEKGKPVKQITRWVIGGTKEQPALASGSSAIYNFVLTTHNRGLPHLRQAKLVSRIALEDGGLPDPLKDFDLQK